MKKKTGFTLAEVLITLAIIGIIAAIVLPALLTSYQYKTVGVKLSKLLSTTENSARAYVVSNDVLSVDREDLDAHGCPTSKPYQDSTKKCQDGTDPSKSFYSNLDAFINETFLMKEVYENDKLRKYGPSEIRNSYNISNSFKGTAAKEFAAKYSGNDKDFKDYAVLKDGTRIQFYPLDGDWNSSSDWGTNPKVPNESQIGKPVLGMIFDPRANGLPTTVRRKFAFVLTELGYVFPSPDDECLWSLYNNDFTSKSAMFAQGTACGKGNNT